ncbi:MAG: HDOD domain-containing protein [Pseudomonadota bacterium]
MEHFIARQPIFDQKQKVFAYELLFRSGLDNFFDCADGDRATSQVIADSLMLFGIDVITGGVKVVINFTKPLLVQGYALLLPKNGAIVEILGDVQPDDETIDVCLQLKQKGYTLALSGLADGPRAQDLLALADIVEVDFQASGPEVRRRIAESLDRKGVRLLAKKVETREEVAEALDMGFSFCQGYFFNKPVIISRKDIPALKIHYLRLLKEINAPEMDFDRLEELIKSEVAMAYKLLRYVNAVSFGFSTKVTSIRQALGRLGENQIRIWASLVALSDLGRDKPLELVQGSAMRGKFCEEAAVLAGMRERAPDLFLMGLFSQLDAIFGRPLEEVLSELPLADDLRAALLGAENKVGRVYRLALAYEKGDWAEMSRLAVQLGVDESLLPGMYVGAVQWMRGVFSE